MKTEGGLHLPRAIVTNGLERLGSARLWSLLGLVQFCLQGQDRPQGHKRLPPASLRACEPEASASSDVRSVGSSLMSTCVRASGSFGRPNEGSGSEQRAGLQELQLLPGALLPGKALPGHLCENTRDPALLHPVACRAPALGSAVGGSGRRTRSA